MKKILATLAAAIALSLFAQSGHAAFTLYDLARDSMYIARGEFVSLQRTGEGDLLTLRCNTWIKNWSGEALEQGAEVVLQPFEQHHADGALGRDVIVGFNLINGKYYFNNSPFAWRSFYFENSDHAVDGLARNEQALRNFVDINRPYDEGIRAELGKRLIMQSLQYEGEWDEDRFPGLKDAWTTELLNQMGWAGTVAARDAAKAFVDHPVFRWTLSETQMQQVGTLLKSSQSGSLERSYMLEIVRRDTAAHPSLNTMMGMLREETMDFCVGKLSALIFQHADREAVISAVGDMAVQRENTQARINALQTLAALADNTALPYVHSILATEQAMGNDKEKFDKDAVRGALKALKKMRDTSSEAVLEAYLASEQCKASRELTKRAWIAYSLIDSNNTNARIATEFNTEKNRGEMTDKGHVRFLAMLLPGTAENPTQKIKREIIQVFNED
jgi:hypothetical protein